MIMRLPKMTTRRWMILLVIVALDLAVIIDGPLSWAIAVSTLTIAVAVLGAIAMLIHRGNEGPGKTLY
jgi:hypothetical protein